MVIFMNIKVQVMPVRKWNFNALENIKYFITAVPYGILGMSKFQENKTPIAVMSSRPINGVPRLRWYLTGISTECISAVLLGIFGELDVVI